MAPKQLPAPVPSEDSAAWPTTTKTGSSKVRTVHMTLQHKGGVTKSFCANCIAQYYTSKDRPIRVIDADPSNKSLAAYKSINAVPLDIMNDSNNVDPRKFDDLIEDIISADTDFVVDNGATNFLPFMAYLVDNRVAEILAANGRHLVLHVPIVGGEALMETIQGFDDIAGNIGESAKIVIWLNEAVKGLIQPGGKEFEETQAYLRHVGKITALVRVPYHSSELFARDMEELLSKKMTFAEAIEGGDFRLMTKQRLKQLQREIFEQIALAV